MNELYLNILTPYNVDYGPYKDLTDEEQVTVAAIQALCVMAAPVITLIVCAIASLL